MININLVIKPKPRLRWRVVVQTVVVVLLLASFGAVGYGGWHRLELLRAERVATEQLRDAYRQEGKGLPEAQSSTAAAEQFLANIDVVGWHQQFSQAAALEALWQRPENVRLLEVTFSGREVTVSGDATTFAATTQYLLDLRALPQVEAVTEVEAEKEATGQTSFTYLVRFREEVAQP